MSTTIRNDDLLLSERLETNYRVEAQDLYDFVGVFSPGTKVLFNNATAPVGWVNIGNSNTNNAALRIVKSGGGVVGGTGNFTTAFANIGIKVPQHKHAVAEDNHSHSANLGSHSHGLTDPGHTHTVTRSVTRAVHQHMTPVANMRDHPDNAMVSNLGNRDNKITPLHYSSIDEGDPSSAAPARSGISVSNGSVSYTSGNNGALGISVKNAGGSATINLRIKYNDFIICEKSP